MRIPTELHEELRDSYALVGESTSDFVKAAIEFELYSSTDFDFGDGLVEELEKGERNSLQL